MIALAQFFLRLAQGALLLSLLVTIGLATGWIIVAFFGLLEPAL